MLAKLMTRKKSYERMMKYEDNINSRSPNALHPLNGQPAHVRSTNNAQGISRIPQNNKQLNHYESTPQN